MQKRTTVDDELVFEKLFIFENRVIFKCKQKKVKTSIKVEQKRSITRPVSDLAK